MVLLHTTPGGAQIIPEVVTYPLWVHPGRGSDANPGTQVDPFRTLTFALTEAAALRNQLEQAPPPPPLTPPQHSLSPQWIIRIHVQSSATPIAPLGYGGHEPEFPNRLERRVDVLGVNSPVHGKARILIDDRETVNYPWLSIPATDGSGTRAFVYGAQNCTLKNFRIDGTTLRRKYEEYSSGGEQKKKAVYGIHTVDKNAFRLEDCDLLGQYNGASWFASSGGTASGTVTGCSFQGRCSRSERLQHRLHRLGPDTGRLHGAGPQPDRDHGDPAARRRQHLVALRAGRRRQRLPERGVRRALQLPAAALEHPVARESQRLDPAVRRPDQVLPRLPVRRPPCPFRTAFAQH